MRFSTCVPSFCQGNAPDLPNARFQPQETEVTTREIAMISRTCDALFVKVEKPLGKE